MSLIENEFFVAEVTITGEILNLWLKGSQWTNVFSGKMGGSRVRDLPTLTADSLHSNKGEIDITTLAPQVFGALKMQNFFRR